MTVNKPPARRGKGQRMNIKTIQREAARQGLTLREETFDGEKTYALYRGSRFIAEANDKRLIYSYLLGLREQ